MAQGSLAVGGFAYDTKFLKPGTHFDEGESSKPRQDRWTTLPLLNLATGADDSWH